MVKRAVKFASPLIGRHGGLLLAFPTGVIDEEAFPGIITNEVQMVGPAKPLEGIELYEEEDAGSGAIQAVKTGVSCPVTVSNFLDSVLVYLRESDPVTDLLPEVVLFDETHPAAVPLHAEVLAPALEWAKGELEGRVLFYSKSQMFPRSELRLRKESREEDFECSLMNQQAMATNGPYPKTPAIHSVLQVLL